MNVNFTAYYSNKNENDICFRYNKHFKVFD